MKKKHKFNMLAAGRAETPSSAAKFLVTSLDVVVLKIMGFGSRKCLSLHPHAAQPPQVTITLLEFLDPRNKPS